MASVSSLFLLADIFDRIRIQLSDQLVNWLTPVWILGVGAIAGLILCGIIWGVAALLSQIPGVGTLAERPKEKWIAVGVLAVIFFVAAVATGVLNLSAAPPQAAAAQGQPADAQAAPAQTGLGRFMNQATAVLSTAAVCVLIGLAVVHLANRRTVAESWIALREGVLWPLFIIACVLAAFAVLGVTFVRTPGDLLANLGRMPTLMLHPTQTHTHTIAAPPNEFDDPPEQEVTVAFRSDEVQRITFASDKKVRVSTEPFATKSPAAAVIDVPAEKEETWRRVKEGANPFPSKEVTQLYVKNYGPGEAELTITSYSQLANPEMRSVPIMALCMASVFVLYLLQRSALPKLAAIALATTKSEMAQPLYAIIMALGIFLLVIFIWIPFFTFGEDIKMLKDSGLNLIRVLCIFQAVWAACSSVADEIDGRTALTVLSKPVSRRDFILGKFVGIAWTVGLMAIAFGLVLLIGVAYKPVYDAREGADFELTWQFCFREMILIVPGLVLAFFEIVVMAAISVAISTRLPTLANFIISFAIYVLGNLTPLLVQSQVVADQLEPVIFLGRVIATVLPVLDHFNIQASVAAGVPVPMVYLGWAFLYCLLYCSIAMLLALTLFEDRDLA